MMTGFISAMFSWIDEFVKKRSDNEVFKHHPYQKKKACQAASALEAKLSEFRKRVSEGFPHRVDALALVDEVEKTLREQHGGLSAAEFMNKFYHNTLGDLSSREDRMATEKLCGRWVRESSTHDEFRDLHPTYNPWTMRGVVFGET